jgi:hypothetical protein
MPEPALDDFPARVRGALRDVTEPLWNPDLTRDLSRRAWRTLSQLHCLTPDTYATARVLRQDPYLEPRNVTSFHVASSDEASPLAIRVEVLSEELAHECRPSLRFFSPEAILTSHLSSTVGDALDILSTVPGLLAAVASLIRALHLIDPGDDEIDISFSDPNLPFTAFVSVPSPGVPVGALRVAEALLHEAMHLQLTLIEKVIPLVLNTGLTFFSPWKDEHRSAQGVLHGLYVFRAVDSFLTSVALNAASCAELRPYVEARQREIKRQIAATSDFRNCSDLTAYGAMLVDRLLA